jgi:two-component system, chemotaxis family, protein-glutamate methylesterase/glutaminase
MSLPVRVLVVDDSVTMRGIITGVLRRDPDIEVVGTAGDPYEARDAIKSLNPDVITLDFEMPKMDGIAFLKKIMKLRPMPVVMISSLTNKGADLAIAALSNGAFDCLGKPVDGNVQEAFSNLPAIIKAASRAKLIPAAETAVHASQHAEFLPNGKIVAIGSSTGGVEALVTLLSGFPENCPPTVIVQHMPELFTASFAARLNTTCAPTVEEAKDGAILRSGCVYLARGGVAHLTVERNRERQYVCKMRETEKVSGHRPSVDVLFKSVAAVAGKRAVGAILTGMGRDGAEGLLQMREAGCVTIGQDKKTSVIYGMPRVAFELNAVQKQFALPKIASAILRACSKNQTDERAA